MKSDNLSQDTDQLFEYHLKQSKDELEKLHRECMGKNFFSPLAQKKRTLIAQLNYLLNELSEEWYKHEDNADFNSAKEFFNAAIQESHLLASLLKDFNKKNETPCKKSIERLNDLIKSINQVSDETSKQNAAIRINLLNYGENLSLSMSYLGSLVQLFFIIGFAFQITLKKAVELAGSIFYPITAVFNTLAKLFQLVTSIAQIIDPRQKALHDTYRDECREKADSLLRTSVAFKSLSFVLNALAIIAFVGLIANPIGWVFIAAATLIDWVDEGIGGVRKAENAYQNQKQKWDEDDHTSESIKNELDICHAHLMKAKNEERWGRVNVVAMILFAAAPIPIVGQALMIIAATVFTVAAARNIYVAVKPRIENYLHPKKDVSEEMPMEVEMSTFNGKNLSTTLVNRKLSKPDSMVKNAKTEMIELQNRINIPSNNSKHTVLFDKAKVQLKKPHTHKEKAIKNKGI